MNSLGLGFLTFGMILLTLGGLGAVGYIPFPSLSQSSVCIQSVVSMATVCSSALSTGMDSISYSGTVIAPVAGGNPVSVPQSQSQGTLIGYYFLASGTTLKSSSANYCSGQGCSPNTPLSTSNSASSSVIGLYLLTTQSPSMTVGTYYSYQFSITDSAGVSSTISGTIVVVAAAPTWTASVKTYNGTYSLGGSSGGGVAGFNIYNVETPNFLVTITNNAPISSVTLNVSPGGQSLGFSYIGNNQWQEGYSTFAVGAYTVTATISSGGQSITAFSVRMTSINQLKLTGVTLTTYTTSCPYSTSTASSAPYSVTLCQVTQGQTLTVSNSGCYTGTVTTISSSTLQGTTCSTGAVTCSAGGCQGTTTTTSGTGTTSGGSTTTGSSTTSTSSTSTSTSKTTVCPNPLACSPSSIPLLPSLVLITGIVFTAIGGFMVGRKPEAGQG